MNFWKNSSKLSKQLKIKFSKDEVRGFLYLGTNGEKYGTMYSMNAFISKSPEETINYAIKIASGLKGGEILALHGNLGGGKTTFTKGLAEGLKVSDTITSPTFVLLKCYQARLPARQGKIENNIIELVHVDAYRSESIDDIKSVGIEDYLDREDVILVIEWAEKIQEILPENVINIYFKDLGGSEREIDIDPKN